MISVLCAGLTAGLPFVVPFLFTLTCIGLAVAGAFCALAASGLATGRTLSLPDFAAAIGAFLGWLAGATGLVPGCRRPGLALAATGFAGLPAPAPARAGEPFGFFFAFSGG
jgi:hypothetical protein